MSPFTPRVPPPYTCYTQLFSTWLYSTQIQTHFSLTIPIYKWSILWEDSIFDLWEKPTKIHFMEKKQKMGKCTEDIEHTIIRGNPNGSKDIPLYNLRIQEETSLQTLHTECIIHAGLLASKITQLWLRSHSHSLSRHSTLYAGAPTTTSTVLPHIIMFALGVFIVIYNIGLFTNIALNATLTLFIDIALSRLRSIRLLSKLIPIWLFGHDQIEQSI